MGWWGLAVVGGVFSNAGFRRLLALAEEEHGEEEKR